MSRASTVVAFAALLLPKELRDRYREQWLADLRDADEAGVDPAEVVWGALAFAATVRRPLVPGLRRPDQDGVTRRARYASVLALSVALLSLAQYGRAVGYGLTGNSGYDFMVFLLTALLVLYCALAVIVSLALVTVTRSISRAVRASVWLLATASFAPVVQGQIDSRWFGEVENMYLTRGMWAYFAAICMVLASCILLWRTFRGAPRDARPVGPAVVSGLALLAGTVISVGTARALWDARIPPEWGDQSELFGAVINQWLFDEWMQHQEAFEHLMRLVLGGCFAVGVLVAVLVAASALSRRMTRGRVTAVAATVAWFLVLQEVALLNFLALALTPFPDSAVQVLALVAQWGLVATLLYSVGGVRFDSKRLARPSHRHDVEGGVELL